MALAENSSEAFLQIKVHSLKSQTCFLNKPSLIHSCNTSRPIGAITFSRENTLLTSLIVSLYKYFTLISEIILQRKERERGRETREREREREERFLPRSAYS